MIVNLIVIVLILFFGFEFSRTKFPNSDSNRKKYIKIICFILILQSGLRNVAVGADTYSYYESFNSSIKRSWSDVFQIITEYYSFGIGKDPGFSVFEKLVSSITGEYQLFLMIIAIIFFISLGSFIFKNTTRLIDAVLAFIIYSVLFYSFFSITGHRQTIATAAALFGFELIKKKKLIAFVIIILIASTIHKSVLIFLPFYFIAQISNINYFYRTVLFLFPIIMVIRNSMVVFFQGKAGYEEYNQLENAGAFTFSLLFLFLSIIALFRKNIILKVNPNTRYYYNAFALAIVFLPLTWIHPSMMRIVQYFSIFMLLFIPEIIKSFNYGSTELRKRIQNFAIIILILLFVKGSWNADPYGFFWEEMRLPKLYYLND